MASYFSEQVITISVWEKSHLVYTTKCERRFLGGSLFYWPTFFQCASGAHKYTNGCVCAYVIFPFWTLLPHFEAALKATLW